MSYIYYNIILDEVCTSIIIINEVFQCTIFYYFTVKPGATFEFVWTVINCGQLPWTEETHLNLISCSPGFEPIKTNVQCPLLEPGDIGQISMEFVAPKMSGTYSSIWNFTHGGYQFGHCLTCMIVVDSAGLPESGRALRSVTESPRSVKVRSRLEKLP